MILLLVNTYAVSYVALQSGPIDVYRRFR